jgi:nucleotide-binding universal stress UspA family protein
VVLRRIADTPRLLDRVLVSLDVGESSDAVLDRVGPLSRAASGEILLLQVVPFLETLLALPEELSADLFQPDLGRAWAYVDAVAARLKAEGLDVRGLVALGPPAGTLLDVARARGATLIALSTRSRGIAKVLRRGSLPILLVPPSPAAVSGSWLFVGEPPPEFLLLSRRLGVSMIQARDMEEARAAAADLVVIPVRDQDDRKRFDRLLRKTSVPLLVLP